LYLAIGLSFFCLGISRQYSQEGYLVKLLGFVVLAIVFFVLFYLRCKRVPEPLVQFSAFKNVVFSAANLTNLFVGGALFIALCNIPLMWETILGALRVDGGSGAAVLLSCYRLAR
jgi:hypothetical protein